MLVHRIRVEEHMTITFFLVTKNFRTRKWCPSPRQGRPSGSKCTYKLL